MLLKINDFGGIGPKFHASRLPEGLSQQAVNMRFERDVLESYRGFNTTGITLSANTKVIFKYDNVYWMGFNDSDISVADAHKVSDPHKYLLIASTDFPRVTRKDIATTSQPYPSSTFRLGVPEVGNNHAFAPVASPIDPNASTPDEDLDIPTVTVYRYAFVDGFGREGALSDPTKSVKFFEGYHKVGLWLPTAFKRIMADVNLLGAKLRIYRANYGSGGVYQFVDEVPWGTQQYFDEVLSEDLGMAPETEDWFAPPDDDVEINPGGPLRNLTPMPGGFFVGSSGDELCASVVDAPHAWPYRISLGDRIVGIETIGNAAVVATIGPTYVVQGVDPASLQPTRINTNQSCVAARSMVNIGEAVIYASPDGLVGVAGYEARLLTQDLITKEEWQRDFKPEEIHAYYYEGKYIFFNATKGWVFRPGGGVYSLSELDFVATAGYSDLESDTLYLLINGQLVTFDTNENRLSYTWVSREFRTASPTNFSYMRVVAEEYPVVATLICKKLNGALDEQTLTFVDYEPQLLKSGFTAKEFSIRVQGTKAVKTVDLAHRKSEFDNA